MRKVILTLTILLLCGTAFSQSTPAKKSKKRDTVKTADKPERRYFPVKFSTLFKEETNGDFTALYPVKINYYTIAVGGTFPLGGSIGGVTLDHIQGHILLVDTVKGVVIYKGVYN